MIKQTNPVETEIPLTAEAREAMLDDMFKSSLPHYGELFLPDNMFYTNAHGPVQAKHMLLKLCNWLGIKPGYIGLKFKKTKTHVPDGQRYTIYLETEVLYNEFLLGSALALALTRYLIEERGQIHASNSDQPVFLATGTVVFGLGLVIINGFVPSYSWPDRIKRLFTKQNTARLDERSFEANYEYLLKGFLKVHAISPIAYQHCLTPWAAKKLGVKMAPKPIHAAHEAIHKEKLANIKSVGILWLVVLVIGIGGFTAFQRVRPQSAKITEVQEQADLLAKLINECKQNLTYQRQYADLTDIQTVRNLNSLSLHCQSLNNRYQAIKFKL